MGALHEGHLALIRHARKRAGRSGTVAVSIFVNPAQFGPREDLSRYPRPLANDTKLCREAGVDLLFVPSPAQMYPEGYASYLDETGLSQTLCGKSRPGHFRGVCTVVAKLFNIISPRIAVFGMKDYQQLAVIKQMTRDLNFPVKIAPHKTIREPDGLALSSRNRHLTAEERAQAPVLRQALLDAAQQAKSGRTGADFLKKSIAGRLASAPLAVIDYVEIVDANTLKPVKTTRNKALAAVAVLFGKTRLIDNILLS